MSERDARRARWRADLHEFGAAALRKAGLAEMADASDAQAESNREYAYLMGRLDEAKAAFKAAADAVPFPTSRSGLAAYQDRIAALPEVAALRAVKLEVVAFRTTERTFGAPRVGVLNNFAEPSDDELIALGY